MKDYINVQITEILEVSYKFKIINHKYGNKLNNNIENLEWCSYSENNLHAYKSLNRKPTTDVANPKAVYMIDTLNKTLEYFESITNTSHSIDLSHTQINRYIHSNKKWKGRYIFLTDNEKGVEDIERIL